MRLGVKLIAWSIGIIIDMNQSRVLDLLALVHPIYYTTRFRSVFRVAILSK